MSGINNLDIEHFLNIPYDSDEAFGDGLESSDIENFLPEQVCSQIIFNKYIF